MEWMCVSAKTLGRDLQGFIEVLEPWMLPASLGPVASVLTSERSLDAFCFLTASAKLPCPFQNSATSICKRLCCK